jgi:hypothetical protein
MMAHFAGPASVIDPSRPRKEQIDELRRAVEECYCGFGPACHLWRQMTPEQRTECSADARREAQRFWKNGM